MEKADDPQTMGNAAAESDTLVNLGFSPKKYSKGLFSLLIIEPLFQRMPKILAGASFVISGFLFGSLISAFVCLVLLQFGAMENPFLSMTIIGHLEKMLPNTELSIKSAALKWNSEAKTFDVNLQKVEVDDFYVPNIVITPNYMESLKKQRWVAKSVTIIDPKVNFATDDFNSFSILTNEDEDENSFDKLEVFKGILGENAQIRLRSANTELLADETTYKVKDLCCEYIVGEGSPRSLSFSTMLPDVKYSTNVKIQKLQEKNTTTYDVKVDALNPNSIHNIFGNVDGELSKLMPLIKGYNLPVSGTLKFTYDEDIFSQCAFDLSASAGVIRLLNDNFLALTLGKKIDGGTISGTISSRRAAIDSISMTYGDSGVNLTNIRIPMEDFVPGNGADINGSLSISNASVQEMNSILPENISKSIIQSFEGCCMPEFKLELFKVDLKGPIRLGESNYGKKMEIGDGTFKIQGASTLIGKDNVTGIDATGKVTSSGLDIKLTKANFRDMTITDGELFISNKDKSWSGNIKATLPVSDLSKHIKALSATLSRFPFEKLKITGSANLDMKVTRVAEDKKTEGKSNPFKVVECKGAFASNYDNTKLLFSWNDKTLDVSGNINSAKDVIKMQIEEDLTKKTGKSSFDFECQSHFLRNFLPITPKWLDGNVALNVHSIWKDSKESFSITANLKDASMLIPVVGIKKQIGENGTFKAKITKANSDFDFSNLVLDMASARITGKLSLNAAGDLKKCSFDKFDIGGSSAKVSLQSDNINQKGFQMSIIGDKVDISKISTMVRSLGKKMLLSAYVNLKEVSLTALKKLKNVKGNIKIDNGNVIGGAGCAVYGKDSTLAVSIKPDGKSKDSLVSMSASNAGELIKYFDLTNCINGGVVNVLFKLPGGKIGNGVSGHLEMTDFIVENSAQLNKLISLSSTIAVPKTGFSLGCNAFVGNVSISDSDIKIQKGKIVSPLIAFTVDTNYDRKSDALDVRGLSLYMSSLGDHSSNGTITSEYCATGSLNSLALSVKPAKFSSYDDLYNLFGNMLPIPADAGVEYVEDDTEKLQPINYKDIDPFDDNAFDKEVAPPPEKKKAARSGKKKATSPVKTKKSNVTVRNVKKKPAEEEKEDEADETTETEDTETRHRIVDKKTGVVINRGSVKRR